ncbi:OmpA family protein [Olivibacter sitiensis]|uniref:OmpA family protein n=1 Tax=Olivibacter sitiensis TaxID=376470 RepID=UPI000423428E|nr:OmpA family protein [Olivibacter sitiensis]
MNYSTIKKAVACSLVASLGVAGAVNAQDAKVFGGRSQYRTWSIGINGGITSPNVLVGGSNAFGNKVGFFEAPVREYYGINIRKQFSSWFGLQVDANRGRIFTHNSEPFATVNAWDGNTYQSAETSVQYAVSLNGVFQLATIDFLRRENAVNFYATAGYGLIAFNPVMYANNDGTGASWDNKGNWGESATDRELQGDRDFKREAYIPVGLGLKFKLSDRVALDLGYTMNFVDTKTLFGPVANRTANDKFSYTHAGLEFSLGKKEKQDLTWANPVATLYDELKDPALRGEVEALKQRVGALEATVDALSKDSDGDGVSDKFDKCPNTPAGTQVDGSGCPINFPEPPKAEVSLGSYSNIQFEFDSSVLKTSSYAVLDQVASDLKASGATITLEGNASSEGPAEYNKQLSIDRANSVKNYLVNAGVAASQLQVVGNGEDKPVASNATEAGRILNRNVQFVK